VTNWLRVLRLHVGPTLYRADDRNTRPISPARLGKTWS
jgi:hypothetical protein